MAAKGQKLSREQREKISEGRRRAYLASLERESVVEPKLKQCSGCGAWKRRGSCSGDSDFHWRRRTKSKSGVVRFYPESRCKVCKNKQNREVRERERANGVDIQLRWRLWFQRKGVRYRKELLRKKREREAIRRREAGELPQPRKGNTTHLKDSHVPAEPIAKWLRTESSAQFKKSGGGDPERSEQGLTLLEQQTGIDKRHLGSLLREEQKQVRLSTVDKILIGLDAPYMLHELYPEDP